MLIKELSKKSRIKAKDLLICPAGLLCYIVDCLNAGCSLDDSISKAMNYRLSALSFKQVIHNRKLLKNVNRRYQNITTCNEVIDLC